MSSCACSGSCAAPLPTEADVRAESKYLAIRFSLAAALFVSAVVSDAVGLPVLVARVFYVSAWLAAGYSVVLQALRNLRCGIVFDENFLMTIATLGAFAIGEWAEGASVMLFYNLGELVQDSAVRKSRKSIVDLLDLRPEYARLDSDGSQVHPADVDPGTRIRVHPGEVIPLDGVIVSGSSDLDTSALTGESLPRSANEGDTVFAGFVNGGGVLVIESSAPFNETAASKMLELVEHAQDRKARAEKRITAFARVYTPIVTILAGLLALAGPFVTSAFGGPAPFSREAFEPWIYRSLVFLVISCPCALVISIPLGFFGGIGGAARRGILVKGADFLDVLANAKAVVFDKTGTLTHGVFSVTGLFPTNGFDERALVRLASAAE
ncbi:MAG: HAD-IC family P-type ATPase [Treponema sp.]|nr:HAD-IC family P-type ATPase [Treponema sp.]